MYEFPENKNNYDSSLPLDLEDILAACHKDGHWKELPFFPQVTIKQSNNLLYLLGRVAPLSERPVK